MGHTISEVIGSLQSEIEESKIQLDTLASKIVEAGLATWSKNKNQNNLIHSIVAKGYQLKLKDNTIYYIKKALVRVYEFKEDKIENKNENV